MFEELNQLVDYCADNYMNASVNVNINMNVTATDCDCESSCCLFFG